MQWTAVIMYQSLTCWKAHEEATHKHIMDLAKPVHTQVDMNSDSEMRWPNGKWLSILETSNRIMFMWRENIQTETGTGNEKVNNLKLVFHLRQKWNSKYKQ